MFGLGYGFDTSIIVLIPAIIFTIWAQAKVNGTFRRYSGIRNSRGITGAQAARVVLDSNGLQNVEIRHISGNLTDHYNPANRTLNLSDSVCNSDSIAAVGVACHEAGHAVQHAEGYVPNKIRSAIVPVANIGSKLSWIVLIIGMLLPVQFNFVITIGIVLFSASVLFTLVTLPVEFNASSRALKTIQSTNMLNESEYTGAKKVLSAAAMTYVAAAATSIAQLLRLLLIFGNRRK